MKNIFKNILGFGMGLALIFTSCETTELDLTQSPNGLSPESADPELFLNAAMEDFARFTNAIGQESGELARIHYLTGRNYQNAFSAQNFDAQWEQAYQNILQDLRTMNPIAAEAGQFRHIGIGQVMEAYIIVTFVDMFGDIPYSQALQGADEFNPGTDGGAQVYDAALALLVDATNNFTRTDAAAGPGWDPFYDNDYDAWVAAANSLRMKINLQRRLVDPAAVGQFEALAGGSIIDTEAENFAFPWGNSQVNPDTRHPYFVADYTPSGAGAYMSNWMMGTMLDLNDPRIRYYYYRQSGSMPGNGADPDEALLQCSVETAPPHYQNGGSAYYCNLPLGYWGRDHGDDDGSPPDTQIKATWGVYPVGGRFDKSEFDLVGPNAPRAGGGGAGVTPILLASTVYFMQAEVALVQGDIAGAAANLRAGIESSVNYVSSFGALDPGFDLTGLNITSAADYASDIVDDFNAATSNEERFNVLGTQVLLSLHGQGIDGYNFYRRTGYPSNLQPNIEPDPGQFIRSFLYPANFVLRNSSTGQKASVTERVFWDNNPQSGFPLSN